jgi:uncharacterized protein YuzE
VVGGSRSPSKVIFYDPEADILSIIVREGKVSDSEWLDNDIVLLYGENKELLEVEVHGARRRGLIDALQQLAEYLGAGAATTTARKEKALSR